MLLLWTGRPTELSWTDLEEGLELLQPRYVNTLYPDSSSLLLHDSRYDLNVETAIMIQNAYAFMLHAS